MLRRICLIGHCNRCFVPRRGERLVWALGQKLSLVCGITCPDSGLSDILEIEYYGNKQAEPNRDTESGYLAGGSGHRYVILRVKSCCV